MHLIKRFFKSDNAAWKAEQEQGKLLRKFGKFGRKKGQLDHPTGISLTKSGDVVVADCENHRIQIFSADGAFKLKFGEQGKKPDQFSYPRCVAMTPDDLIAVSDMDNAAVKLFTLRGKLESVFADHEKIKMPHGLAVTGDGYFVLTDIQRHCVVVLSPLGDVDHDFGSLGDGAEQFDHPYHVTTNSNKQIIVADTGNSAIKIFHFKGRLLRVFRPDDFKLPGDFTVYLAGLATDGDDNTLVSSAGTIFILTRNGRLWEIFTEEDGLTFPRYVTWSPVGRVYVTQGGAGCHDVCIFRYNKDDYSEELKKMEDEDKLKDAEEVGEDSRENDGKEGQGRDEEEEGKLDQAAGGGIP